MDRFSTEIQRSLFHDGGLYKAVKSALLLSQSKFSTGSKTSENLKAVQSTLDDLRDKFETDLIDEIQNETKFEVADSRLEEEVDRDGYHTIDLNTYSDSKLISIDTGITSVTTNDPMVVNGFIGNTTVILDSELDLDSTLLAGDTHDHNDTGDHSDIEVDPLATSSETKLTVETNADSVHSMSSLSDDHINIYESTDIKEGQDKIVADTKIQSDHLNTEPVPMIEKSDSVIQPTRSKSKVIPARSAPITQHNESIDTQDTSSNSVTSVTPSSVGEYNRISLSEPQSLERQTEVSDESPLSLGGSLVLASATLSMKIRPKSEFAQRVETALNTQLSISSVASAEGEDDLIAIPVSKGGGGESTGSMSGGGKGKKRKSRKKKNAGALSRRMSNPEIRGNKVILATMSSSLCLFVSNLVDFVFASLQILVNSPHLLVGRPTCTT